MMAMYGSKLQPFNKKQDGNIIRRMGKTKKNYTQSANIRMPDGLRDDILEAAEKRKIEMPTWSGNDEYVYRLQRSFKVPDDIITACIELGDVTDRLDFAVRLFKQAGFNVSIPEE